MPIPDRDGERRRRYPPSLRYRVPGSTIPANDGEHLDADSDTDSDSGVRPEPGASASQHEKTDSPIFQLLEDYPNIQREKTDVFRERVHFAQKVKEDLARARESGKEAVVAVERSLGPFANQEAGVLIDLLLSYRAVKAWEEMIALVEQIPKPVADTVLVQEQYAFALNRAGRGQDAERALRAVLEKKGPSSETLGLLGRVYKDRWEAKAKQGDRHFAEGLLNQAIEAYVPGFEADWRDAYPGIDATSLMEVKQPPDPRRKELIGVVKYAAQRRVASGKPDYWDYATLLEAAVLDCDEDAAWDALQRALPMIREPWEPESTARNLRLIREAREFRNESIAWATEIENALVRAGAQET